jgi:hypothetical protein
LNWCFLHCPNERLRAEAWEGKDPGDVWVLLANPRWERRFVKFLELLKAVRVMADETNEDGARAARMDEWVIWGAEERVTPEGQIAYLPFLSLSRGLVPRDLRIAHRRG